MATKTAREFYILKGGYDKDGKWYLGRARLFFINKFTHHKEFNLEYDINIDVKPIKRSLEFYQIKVDDPILNQTKKEMIQCFQDDIDYFGCAIIFIFTHGEQDHFYCSDYDEESGDGKINVWDDYYHYFSRKLKPKLEGCPKVFFNEWCQEDRNATTADVKAKISLSHDTADWLIYNAAQPTFPTYGNSIEGSYSTQAFCRLLEKYGETDDLEHILTLVRNEDYKAEVGQWMNLQPLTSLSLLKKLYLLPEGKIYQLMSIYRNEFEHIGVLGEGKFGVVFKVKNVKDKILYAVKRIQLINNTDEEQNRINREIDFLARSNCPYVVRYYRSWDERAEYNCQKNEDKERQITELEETHSRIIDFTFIQMELCRETLEVYLKNNTQRDKIYALNIFKQILKGLAFLHARNKVHRDLKPANILFALTDNDRDLFVRIADFGLAREVGNSSTIQVAGTLLYMAPEMGKKCNTKVDMYSVGLILLELLYDCSGENHDDILIGAKHNSFPEAFNKELKIALPLLQKLLSHKPSERPTSDEVLAILRNWNEDLKLATASNAKSTIQWPWSLWRKEKTAYSHEEEEEELQFESICTLEDHLMIHEVSRWLTHDTLLYNREKSDLYYFRLSAASATKTRWEVKLYRDFNNDFLVSVRCVSLDSRFRAASIRMHAMVEGHPQVWSQVSAVLQSGEGCSGYFSKKPPNFLQIKVRVRTQWTELMQLPSARDLWKDCAAHVRCRWQLKDWKTVTQNSVWWCLFSEAFGQKGALWRIIVWNRRRSSDKKLIIEVLLQHLPASVNWSIMSWKCSLSVWDQQFNEQETNMEQNSRCVWTVVDDVISELRNPLDMNVVIHVSSKN